MKYKKITSYKQEDNNPFTDSLKTVIHKKNIVAGRSADNVIIDIESGEQTGHVAFMKIQEYDKQQFVKFYVDNLKMFFGLSKKAIRVLVYIMQALKPRKDTVLIDTLDCAEYTNYARSTVFSAIAELLENKFIARTKTNQLYYINPSIFFNGNRASFVKQLRLVPKERIELSEELDRSITDKLLD